MAVKIHENGQKFFAEVEGMDLSRPLSDENRRLILKAAFDNAVLLFRGQSLDEEQHLALSRNFGGLETTVQRDRKRRVRPEFADISNLDWDGSMLDIDSGRAIYSSANQLWHSDASFRSNPPKFSLLYAEEVVCEGGETEFCDERAAWEALDDGIKHKIDGLIAWHSLMESRRRTGFVEFTDGEREAFPSVPQPVVRTHPATGRRNLFLGAHASHIEGLDRNEGARVLDELLDFATQSAFITSYTWSVGDLIMWDNRCVLHRGRPYKQTEERRVMRRTTISGDGPVVVDGKPIDEVAAHAALNK
jgi:alpha-ketoglutarate-dependent 2,4-dichlorophenoxyacetate dioxygenase